MIALLLLFDFILTSNSEEQYVAKTVWHSTEANDEFFNNNKVSLKPINRYVSHINIDTDLVKTLQNYECSVQRFSCYNNYCNPFFINITFDLCEFNGKSKHFYVNAIYRSIPKNATNLLRSCPLLPGHYFLHNFTANVKIFKVFPVPAGTYRFDSVFRTNIGGKTVTILKSSAKTDVFLKDSKDIAKRKH